jgi:asparagine synthase (glutamine-hydrolysing)
MCGIVGIVAAAEPLNPAVLQQMNDLLSHRGPDGEGFFLASGEWSGLRYSFHRRVSDCGSERQARVGLGHRRLAILDLSERGLQPMSTQNGKTWIVFNGEIYNYLKIRADLAARGHVFTTRTDTEVLLNAYAEWGEECLGRLDGMFAFAIWDDAKNRLFCGRDRLGIKPFYYASLPGGFVFASEIKALFAVPGVTKEIDDQAAVGFLVHGNSDYSERTLFRRVKALPAAHSLIVEGTTGRLTIRPYWKLEPHPLEELSHEDYVARLRATLAETVKSHLISDVRVGSCLSGGLDSSTIVALMGKIWRDSPEAATAIGDRLYTFTSCYDAKAFDEREYALEVANLVGAKPHLVFPSPEDFWSDFQRMAWHQDMPFSCLNFYAQWRVMRAAKENGVKVLLDGQGGDEVFGGYAKFRYAYVMSLLREGRIGAATREVAGMLQRGDRYILDLRNGYRYLPASLRRALKVDSVVQHVVNRDWNQALSEESTPGTRWWRNALHKNGQGATLMQRIQVDDISIDTLPQLLRMEDRSSMAFSLEARVPLLDHKVVEMGLSLPDDLKVHRGWSKFAVREGMTGLLPDSVRLRKTKLGFAAPDRAWLGDELREPIAELLQSELRSRRYVDVQAVRQWHQSPEAKAAGGESLNGLFRILSLEMWMRAFNLS